MYVSTVSHVHINNCIFILQITLTIYQQAKQRVPASISQASTWEHPGLARVLPRSLSHVAAWNSAEPTKRSLGSLVPTITVGQTINLDKYQHFANHPQRIDRGLVELIK